MLATRDQENLAHGHQTTAASKPLNQSTRQLAPKTPGNKAPKTPFKLPLNDENGPTGFGGGKTGLRLKDVANGDLLTGGKKGVALDRNAFVTPMGTTRTPESIESSVAEYLLRSSESCASGSEDDQCQSQSFSNSGRCSYGQFP